MAANIVVNASPSDSPGISTGVAVPAVPPMNSTTRMGPPMKPVVRAQSEHERLREHDHDQQARTEGRPVADHRGQLAGPGEQRQRQRHGDQTEDDSPDRRAKDGPFGERSGELGHDADRDECDQRERPGGQSEGTAASKCQSLYLCKGTSKILTKVDAAIAK